MERDAVCNVDRNADRNADRSADRDIFPIRMLVLLVVLFSFVATLVLTPAFYWIHRQLPPGVGCVDLQSLVEEHGRDSLMMSAPGVVDAGSRDAKAADFARRLSDAVTAVGAQCHCVLVNKAAVLGGDVEDFTDAVRRMMGEAP